MGERPFGEQRCSNGSKSRVSSSAGIKPPVIDDPAARSVVADRVREDVVKEPLEQGFISDRMSRFETNLHSETLEICDSQKTRSERGDVDELAPVESRFTSGEDEACLEQSLLLHARLPHPVCDLAPRAGVRVAIGECEPEKRTLGRKR